MVELGGVPRGEDGVCGEVDRVGSGRLRVRMRLPCRNWMRFNWERGVSVW